VEQLCGGEASCWRRPRLGLLTPQGRRRRQSGRSFPHCLVHTWFAALGARQAQHARSQGYGAIVQEVPPALLFLSLSKLTRQGWHDKWSDLRGQSLKSLAIAGGGPDDWLARTMGGCACRNSCAAPSARFDPEACVPRRSYTNQTKPARRLLVRKRCVGSVFAPGRPSSGVLLETSSRRKY
jgi:hypothetical protein